MFRVVITDDRFGGVYEPEREVLSSAGVELIPAYEMGEEDRLAACRQADAILVNQMPMDKTIIQSLERCKVISRYGTGYEKVDAEAAAQRGIWLARVPDYCYDEVAEHTLALLLAASRRIAVIDRSVREGAWNLHAQYPIPRLKGKVLGILGYGGTGRSFHRKAEGLDFSRVIICDHHADTHTVAAGEAEIVSFEELLRCSDILSVHIPMREENYHLIDDRAFSMMKNGAIFINTARGAIVDQEALYRALRSGKLSAAGIDVFEEEPLSANGMLRNCPELVVSDHNAYYSQSSIVDLKRKTAENVLAVLLGGYPHNFVIDIRER